MRQTIFAIIVTTLTTTSVLKGDEGRGHCASGSRLVSIADRARQKELRAQEESEQGGLKAQAGVFCGREEYLTGHRGALHWPIDVSASGSEVVLEDGSLWSVRSGDWVHTRNWYETDQILIAPNRSFFSCYDYILVNQSSGATVEVNLMSAPQYTTLRARLITGFNDHYDYIYLDDGSVWSISFFDHDAMLKWCLNDEVIIGVNNGWDKQDLPNILINATINQYLRANCIQ